METNFEAQIKSKQTEELRSKFETERKFLRKFYKRDYVPTRIELSISIAVLVFGILFFFLNAELNKGFSFVIVCAIITSLSTIIRYFRNKND